MYINHCALFINQLLITVTVNKNCQRRCGRIETTLYTVIMSSVSVSGTLNKCRKKIRADIRTGKPTDQQIHKAALLLQSGQNLQTMPVCSSNATERLWNASRTFNELSHNDVLVQNGIHNSTRVTPL